MKKKIQLILLATCLIPILSSARQETQAERRTRIMRKYLRDNATVSTSKLEVPVASREEKVTDSQKFKDVPDMLKHQEAGAVRPPPPPRRRRPAVNPNWLLDDSLSTTETKKKETKKKTWSDFGTTSDPSTYGRTRTDSLFGQKSSTTSSKKPLWYQPRQNGGDSLKQNNAALSGNPATTTQQIDPNSAQGAFDFFTKKKATPSPTFRSGTLDLSKDRSSNSALNQSHLSNPFQRRSTPSSNRSYNNSSTYKSLFQTAQERNLKKQSDNGQSQTQQEYKRKNSFQEWKKKDAQRFNPNKKDDVFINQNQKRR